MLLSKSAQSVQDVLNQKGIEAKVVELPASTRTADEAAKAIGCEVAQIVRIPDFSHEAHPPSDPGSCKRR